ncbi:hypothetical protein GDO81_008023 [Engystomops pustulosus]|uniref:Uncharacterized protein n=1 Tax=Engystomops pustulosus TaxID=76066 RepID=A0AAV7CCG2_ENGPU|nr:hypothetical protein GDO81_008023 [Engystomops pustulosus]
MLTVRQSSLAEIDVRYSEPAIHSTLLLCTGMLSSLREGHYLLGITNIHTKELLLRKVPVGVICIFYVLITHIMYQAVDSCTFLKN